MLASQADLDRIENLLLSTRDEAAALAILLERAIAELRAGTPSGLVDWADMQERAAEIAQNLQPPIPPRQRPGGGC